MRTLLRPLVASDRDAFLAAVGASRALHHPWVDPPADVEDFAMMVARTGETFRPFLLLERASGAPAGVFNLSQIFLGAFQSAYLGYYAFAGATGRGLMTEGMHLLLRAAFHDLGLHRVEANVRPENTASIRLVRRVGFEREGYSQGYLYLDGAWRDHERWAIRRETWQPPAELGSLG